MVQQGPADEGKVALVPATLVFSSCIIVAAAYSTALLFLLSLETNCPVRHCCSTTLGKLFKPVCLGHQAVLFGMGLGAVMLFGWEGNCSPGGKWWQHTAGFMTKSPMDWLPRDWNQHWAHCLYWAHEYIICQIHCFIIIFKWQAALCCWWYRYYASIRDVTEFEFTVLLRWKYSTCFIFVLEVHLSSCQFVVTLWL